LEIAPQGVDRATPGSRCEPFATGTKLPTGGWRNIFSSKEMLTMAESKKTPDAVALLKADHRAVEELFEKYEKASGEGRKQKLAEQICMELTVHAKIEEEIFYPACEGKVEEDLLKEAYVEHDAAKLLIAQIEAGGPGDEFYDAKVTVLQEEIEHHVEEEEKRVEGIFAQARKAGLDMDALGEQLAARKAELIATYKKSGLPKPELTTMDV
jgi:hemerythrin superfamily protein